MVFQHIVSELRIAARTLTRTPAFTATVVLILALGIGTTSAVFTVVNAVLLHPLPFPEPDRLVFIRGYMQREAEAEWPVGYQDLVDLGARQPALVNLSAVTGARSFNLDAGEGITEHLTGEMASAEYFAALGVAPVLGRLFTAEEARPPGVPVVVLSEDLWASRFGRSPDVLGRLLVLNERSYQVIGVAADGFRGLSDEARLWLPIGLAGVLYGEHYTTVRQFRWLSGVARIAPGVTMEQAQHMLDSASVQMATEFAADNKDFGFRATAMPDIFFGGLDGPLTALFAASAFVLLIACSNVSALLLVRGTARRRETSLRLALGAGKWGVVRQVTAEGVVLAATGCVVGLLLGALAVKLLVSGATLSFPSFTSIAMDWRVALAAVLASIVCVMVFSLAPSFLALRMSPVDGLKEGGGNTGGRSGHAVRRVLVGVEVALAVMLLVGAARMIGEFRRLVGTDLGMETDGILTARLDLTGPSYATTERVSALGLAILEPMGNLPGVKSVALEGPGLPTGAWYAAHFRLPEAGNDPSDALVGRRHHVTPGYFTTLGVPLRLGRDFTTADVAGGSRVIILSETLARQAFPNVDPIGRILMTIGPEPVPLTVVGVVGDVKQGGYSSEAGEDPNIYIPLLQSPPRSPSLVSLLVKTDGDASVLAAGIEAIIKREAPGLPLYDVRTMEDRLDEQMASSRLLLALMSGFAAIALLLAAVGVYGVSAAAVHEARRDIGIRIALGASARSVGWLVVRQSVLPVVVGLLTGIALVKPISRFGAQVLEGIDSGAPALVAGMVVALLVSSVIASVVPAWRAMRVDPVGALRRD